MKTELKPSTTVTREDMRFYLEALVSTVRKVCVSIVTNLIFAKLVRGAIRLNDFASHMCPNLKVMDQITNIHLPISLTYFNTIFFIIITLPFHTQLHWNTCVRGTTDTDCRPHCSPRRFIRQLLDMTPPYYDMIQLLCTSRTVLEDPEIAAFADVPRAPYVVHLKPVFQQHSLRFLQPSRKLF